ncbi:hypothetical protein [Lysinibacillus sp. RS10]|uniref:hypothetical protein n=1 Tax=Lysinibacillus sp. RS10 TaxID=3242678 RepID=UPI0035C1D5A1
MKDKKERLEVVQYGSGGKQRLFIIEPRDVNTRGQNDLFVTDWCQILLGSLVEYLSFVKTSY